VYCNSSINALTSSTAHTDPTGTSSDMSMIQAPVTAVTSWDTSHSRAVVTSPSPL